MYVYHRYYIIIFVFILLYYYIYFSSNDCNNKHGIFSDKKNDSQNELFESNENYNNNEYVQEKEVRDSIANSFDAIVNVIRQYKTDVSKSDNLRTNEISVQDTVNFGINADTFLTNVKVNGLKDFDSQNFTMVWGEDLVSLFNNNIHSGTRFIY